ncbi:hypothetical protein [Aerococcus mictus]
MGAIQITENIRVRRKDKLNVVVEILQTVTNPKTKERRTEWVENGFYRNLRQALQGLRTKDGFNTLRGPKNG